MDDFKKYENKLLKILIEELKRFNLFFEKEGITYHGPTVEVWKSSIDNYESEFRVYFYQDGKFLEVIECHIFRRGKKLAELEEFKVWFENALSELKKRVE